MHILQCLGTLLLLALPAFAQFGNIFEQMFGQQQGGPHQPQMAGSDSTWYRQQHDAAHCDKYLCPHTLSCVHFPHHCPCPWPNVNDKVELGEGSMICASKGGFKAGETVRKIELARKGML